MVKYSAAFVLLAGLALTCGGEEKPSVCVPGRTNLCACPMSKAKGVETCLRDGSGYGSCEGCSAVVTEGGFTEVSEQIGITYRQGAPFDPPSNCITPLACQLNVITGGAAVGDYDGLGTVGMETPRHGLANAIGPTGDNDHLILDMHVSNSSKQPDP
jgi:hypothetical protein